MVGRDTARLGSNCCLLGRNQFALSIKYPHAVEPTPAHAAGEAAAEQSAERADVAQGAIFFA
jgi:hypothetical protein